MKKIIISLLILLGVTSAFGQSYYEILQAFATKSEQAKMFKAEFSADSLSLRRGLNPLDPSVEFEYIFDNSFELSIRQQFDFPTLYHQRNVIAKKGIDKAQLQHRLKMRNLLMQLSDLYQQFVYYSDMVDLLQKRKDNLVKRDSLAKIAFEKGSITILEFKKNAMMLNASFSELNNAVSEKNNTIASLKQLGVILSQKAKFEQFNFNGNKEQFVQNVIQGDAGMEILKLDSLIANHEIKLAKQEWIPKLELGYKAEFEPGAMKNRLIAGLSIPLWQNRNNVKYTKAFSKAVQTQSNNAYTLFKVELENLFDKYQAASMNVKAWDKTDFSNYQELMEQSIESRAITTLDYLTELTDWQNVQLQILKDRYEHALYGGRMAVYFSFN